MAAGTEIFRRGRIDLPGVGPVGPSLLAASAGLIVLIALGLVGFARQTLEGHHLTGLSNAVPWGLYIAGFIFFLGASTGATIIGLMVHGFGRDDYAPLATRALLVGLLSLIASVLFVTVDVGSVSRMLQMPWIHRNTASMLVYTSLTYYAFGLILAAELYYAVKVNRRQATPRDRLVAKWLAIAAVPFALVIVQAADGGLFAVAKARELWSNPLLPPHFAVAALLTGTALMTVVAVLTSAFNGKELIGKRTLAHMGGLLALFVFVAAFMDFFDFLVYRYAEEEAGAAAWSTLTDERLGLSILHVGGYVVAFAILLVNRGRSVRWQALAAVVALVAVASYRYNLTTVGLGVPLFSFLQDAGYAPTAVEIMVALGIVSLMTLAYLVITRVLPLEESVGASERREPAGAP